MIGLWPFLAAKSTLVFTLMIELKLIFLFVKSELGVVHLCIHHPLNLFLSSGVTDFGFVGWLERTSSPCNFFKHKNQLWCALCVPSFTYLIANLMILLAECSWVNFYDIGFLRAVGFLCKGAALRDYQFFGSSVLCFFAQTIFFLLNDLLSCTYMFFCGL